jgi:hypothetical protein
MLSEPAVTQNPDSLGGGHKFHDSLHDTGPGDEWERLAVTVDDLVVANLPGVGQCPNRFLS